MNGGGFQGYRSKEDWLEYLESVHPSDIEMGLGRVSRVAASLDLFKPAPITIVVGGTNGKGTTTALLGQLLAEKGLTSACYNSPHIHQYNERINKRDSSTLARLSTDEELCQAFEAIEEGRGDIPLTYFEFGTLAALWQIKQWQVDVALLEVGLGGRLDAVNIVDTDLAIVTSVGLDHQDWLGDTLDLIGYEKAGIGRKDKPLICGQQGVSQGFIEHAKKLGVNSFYQGIDFSVEQKDDNLLVKLNLLLDQTIELNLPKGHIPYPNIASAVAGLQAIDLLPSPELIAKAINQTRVAGRLTRYNCQYKGNNITLVLDVAHNAQAAQFLENQVEGCDTAILAMLADKDPQAVVQSMKSIKHWHLAGLDGYRGQSSEQLKDKITGSNLEQIKDVQCQQTVSQALNKLLNSARFCQGDLQGPVLIIGSFLTVSAAQQAINNIEGLTVNGI